MDHVFVDQYASSKDAGIGTVHSCRYSKQRNHIQNNFFSSCSACIRNGQITFYGIFSGFNGGDATSKYVMNQMVYELFQESPINTSHSPSLIIQTIKKKFENVAERYLMMNTEILNERLLKIEENSDVGNDAVSEIDERIRQGTTALIVLKICNDLYVLNCGCSLALAITNECSIQLNSDLHNKDNEKEKRRIHSLGINPNEVLNPTRAVGDLHRTHLYEENKSFSHASGPPVISTPDVKHYKIDDRWQHLVLLSDGVIQNLKEVEVDDIPTEVFVRLSEDHTLTSTAQALADGFARKHLDAFITMQTDSSCGRSNHREEMTVIYVKLTENPQNLYEPFDSAISSIDSTYGTISGTTRLPYVDSKRFKSGDNFAIMENLSK